MARVSGAEHAVADDYATYVGPSLLPVAATMLALAGVRTGDVVLDIGCGSGLLTLPAAAAAGDTGLVLGVDLSRPMLDRARERPWPVAAWAQADALWLPVRDRAVEKVLAGAVVNYVADAGRLVSEMRRVLVDGGRAAVCAFGDPRDTQGEDVVLAALAAEGVDSDACRRPTALVVNGERHGPAAIGEVMAARGFQISHAVESELTLPFVDAATFARWRLSFPAASGELSRHGGGAALLARVVAAAGSALPPGPVMVTATVHYAVGT